MKKYIILLFFSLYLSPILSGWSSWVKLVQEVKKDSQLLVSDRRMLATGTLISAIAGAGYLYKTRAEQQPAALNFFDFKKSAMHCHDFNCENVGITN